MDDQRCMRCGEWVDLNADGYYSGRRFKSRGTFHPWGDSYCVHDRCKILDDEH